MLLLLLLFDVITDEPCWDILFILDNILLLALLSTLPLLLLLLLLLLLMSTVPTGDNDDGCAAELVLSYDCKGGGDDECVSVVLVAGILLSGIGNVTDNKEGDDSNADVDEGNDEWGDRDKWDVVEDDEEDEVEENNSDDKFFNVLFFDELDGGGRCGDIDRFVDDDLNGRFDMSDLENDMMI